MMLKRTMAAAAAFGLAVTFVAAQESATLTLRSGEKVTGQLVDMGGQGFTVKVGDNQRQIPTAEVAVIDFAGSGMSQQDWDRLSSGQHVIWLRNGETITGQLYDIGGTTPLRITVKTSGAERELTSNEVSRIAMARLSETAATSGAGGGQAITVPANRQWTATGITVRQGQRLTITAQGDIRLSSDPNDRATASGIVNQRYDSRAPLPRTLAGALIGRIGNGEPFGIGANNTFTAPGTGQLFLGINESNVSDNEGSFQVTVQTSGSTGRRR